MAGGGAAVAATLSGAKFLAKPALSSASGTAGSISAPIYATIENIASVVLMTLLLLLSQVNPWLLVGLLAVVALVLLGLLAYAVYLLWKLGKGIGRVIRLIETRPKTGLSIVAEFLVWGSGWMVWKQWNKGGLRLAFWILWLVGIFLIIPAVSAALVIVPFLATAVLIMGETMTVMIGLYVGARSARSLMRMFDDAGNPVQGFAPATPTPSPAT
jgi:hypothetical protein